MDAEKMRKIFENLDYAHASGTPEELRAAEYLKARCEALGVQAWLEEFRVPMGRIEEAQVLAEEDEVKELLGQLNIVANRLNEIATGLSNQQQAIGSATTKEGLSKIDGLLGDYKNELAKMAEGLNNLRTKLKTILTAVSPLAIDGKKIVGCYDTNGRPTDIRKKGLKILRLSDGTTRKVYIK
jgi:hypothetical protein